MKKYIFTFGSSHLKEFAVFASDVLLIVEADNEVEARKIVFDSPIGDKFCTSYPYERYIDDFKNYNMIEYTFEELMGLHHE